MKFGFFGNQQAAIRQVSVPLRGRGHEIHIDGVRVDAVASMVSVPLRGRGHEIKPDQS